MLFREILGMDKGMDAGNGDVLLSSFDRWGFSYHP